MLDEVITEDKITVHECGGITGVGRYTEIPFEALSLSEHNMMSKDSKRKEFVVSFSKKHSPAPAGASQRP